MKISILHKINTFPTQYRHHGECLSASCSHFPQKWWCHLVSVMSYPVLATPSCPFPVCWFPPPRYPGLTEYRTSWLPTLVPVGPTDWYLPPSLGKVPIMFSAFHYMLNIATTETRGPRALMVTWVSEPLPWLLVRRAHICISIAPS